MPYGLTQKAGGFFPGKTQITVADLDQLTTHAPASEGKFGIGARSEDQVEISGKMIEEEQHGIRNGLMLDHMVVIQDENEFFALLPQLIEQHGQDGRKRRSLLRVQESKRLLPNLRKAGWQRCNARYPETERIIIHHIKREPGHSKVAFVPLRPGCLADPCKRMR